MKTEVVWEEFWLWRQVVGLGFILAMTASLGFENEREIFFPITLLLCEENCIFLLNFTSDYTPMYSFFVAT